MKSRKHSKMILISSISLSLLSVLAASVSTFAWFQASANVNIETTSASTTITVNKPDSYTFWYYKGNTASHTPNGTFSNDFAAIDSTAKLNQQTNFTNMKPGDIFVFAVSVTEATGSTLTIDKIISNDATKQGIYDQAETPAIQRRLVKGTNYEVNIGWAMDIFVYAATPTHNSAPTGYTSFLTATTGTDKFNYSASTNRTVLEAGSYANPEITLETPITLYSNNSLSSSNDLYIFYSVVFSNDSNTFYKEVTESSNNIIYEAPKIGDRRFMKDSIYGNSSCYACLKFALTALTLNIVK